MFPGLSGEMRSVGPPAHDITLSSLRNVTAAISIGKRRMFREPLTPLMGSDSACLLPPNHAVVVQHPIQPEVKDKHDLKTRWSAWFI